MPWLALFYFISSITMFVLVRNNDTNRFFVVHKSSVIKVDGVWTLKKLGPVEILKEATKRQDLETIKYKLILNEAAQGFARSDASSAVESLHSTALNTLHKRYEILSQNEGVDAMRRSLNSFVNCCVAQNSQKSSDFQPDTDTIPTQENDAPGDDVNIDSEHKASSTEVNTLHGDEVNLGSEHNELEMMEDALQDDTNLSMNLNSELNFSVTGEDVRSEDDVNLGSEHNESKMTEDELPGDDVNVDSKHKIPKIAESTPSGDEIILGSEHNESEMSKDAPQDDMNLNSELNLSVTGEDVRSEDDVNLGSEHESKMTEDKLPGDDVTVDSKHKIPKTAESTPSGDEVILCAEHESKMTEGAPEFALPDDDMNVDSEHKVSKTAELTTSRDEVILGSPQENMNLSMNSISELNLSVTGKDVRSEDDVNLGAEHNESKMTEYEPPGDYVNLDSEHKVSKTAELTPAGGEVILGSEHNESEMAEDAPQDDMNLSMNLDSELNLSVTGEDVRSEDDVNLGSEHNESKMTEVKPFGDYVNVDSKYKVSKTAELTSSGDEVTLGAEHESKMAEGAPEGALPENYMNVDSGHKVSKTAELTPSGGEVILGSEHESEMAEDAPQDDMNLNSELNLSVTCEDVRSEDDDNLGPKHESKMTEYEPPGDDVNVDSEHKVSKTAEPTPFGDEVTLGGSGHKESEMTEDALQDDMNLSMNLNSELSLSVTGEDVRSEDDVNLGAEHNESKMTVYKPPGDDVNVDSEHKVSKTAELPPSEDEVSLGAEHNESEMAEDAPQDDVNLISELNLSVTGEIIRSEDDVNLDSEHNESKMTEDEPPGDDVNVDSEHKVAKTAERTPSGDKVILDAEHNESKMTEGATEGALPEDDMSVDSGHKVSKTAELTPSGGEVIVCSEHNESEMMEDAPQDDMNLNSELNLSVTQDIRSEDDVKLGSEHNESKMTEDEPPGDDVNVNSEHKVSKTAELTPFGDEVILGVERNESKMTENAPEDDINVDSEHTGPTSKENTDKVKSGSEHNESRMVEDAPPGDDMNVDPEHKMSKTAERTPSGDEVIVGSDSEHNESKMTESAPEDDMNVDSEHKMSNTAECTPSGDEVILGSERNESKMTENVPEDDMNVDSERTGSKPEENTPYGEKVVLGPEHNESKITEDAREDDMNLNSVPNLSRTGGAANLDPECDWSKTTEGAPSEGLMDPDSERNVNFEETAPSKGNVGGDSQPNGSMSLEDAPCGRNVKRGPERNKRGTPAVGRACVLLERIDALYTNIPDTTKLLEIPEKEFYDEDGLEEAEDPYANATDSSENYEPSRSEESMSEDYSSDYYQRRTQSVRKNLSDLLSGKSYSPDMSLMKVAREEVVYASGSGYSPSRGSNYSHTPRGSGRSTTVSGSGSNSQTKTFKRKKQLTREEVVDASGSGGYSPTSGSGYSHSPSSGRSPTLSDSGTNSQTKTFKQKEQLLGEEKEPEAFFSLQGGKAFLRVVETMHSGSYKSSFDNRLSVSLARFSSDAHRPGILCSFEKKCSYTRNKNQLDLKLDDCLAKGLYVGEDIEISNFSLGTLKIEEYSEPTVSNAQAGPSRKSPSKKRGALKSKCIFCKKVIASRGLTDHLKRLHGDEQRVRDALESHPKSRERMKVFRELKNQGNRTIDKAVPKDLRISNRRPSIASVAKSIVCPNCQGLFSANNYSRHDRLCAGRPHNYKRAATIARKVEAQKQISSEDTFSRCVQKLLAPLKDDYQTDMIKRDPALMAMARFYSLSGTFNGTKGRNVRQQLRLLARLLIVIKNIDPSIVNYSDLFHLNKYDLLLSGVMEYIGMNPAEGKIEKHSAGMLLKSCVSNLASALQFSYVSDNENGQYDQKIVDLKNFTDMHAKLFKESINKPSYMLRAEKRMLKPEADKMIVDADLELFMNHVEDVAGAMLLSLREESFKFKNWKLLGKATLTLIVTFNRRRVGEASKMLLQSFDQRSNLSEDSIKEMALSPLEKTLAKNFCVMRLVGKNVRENTVLLSRRHVEEAAGVAKDNKYLFGVPTSQTFLDAAAAIRKFAHECGASKPDTLRGGLFRRHAATMSQMLQMDSNDIQQLSDFLGHTVETHKRHYRTVCNFQEICVLSRFFLSAAKGDISKYRGKPISEIEVMLDEDFPLGVAENDEEEPANLTTPQLMEDMTPSNGSPTKRMNATPTKHLVPSPFVRCKPLKTPTPQKTHAVFNMTPDVVGKPTKRKRSQYTEEQTQALLNEFEPYIKRKKYPARSMEFYASFLSRNEELFPGKQPQHIHSFLQYRMKK